MKTTIGALLLLLSFSTIAQDKLELIDGSIFLTEFHTIKINDQVTLGELANIEAGHEFLNALGPFTMDKWVDEAGRRRRKASFDGLQASFRDQMKYPNLNVLGAQRLTITDSKFRLTLSSGLEVFTIGSKITDSCNPGAVKLHGRKLMISSKNQTESGYQGHILLNEQDEITETVLYFN
ncbi:MAG: hypothetical protein JXQ90_17560 [Cyclobacteriaceae bacterium]